MATRRMRLEAACPACQEHTIDYTASDLDLPYFGDVLQVVFECASCGFRHSDITIGKAHSPQRWTFQADSEQDLMVRVVRSTSCTVRIPELGFLIEPGPASDAFVTNVEGILVRIESVLEQLLRDAEEPEQRRQCEERLRDLRRAKEGRYPFTLVLEDPYGNSLIGSDEARVEPLTPEEATALPRGELSFDVSEIGPAKPDETPTDKNGSPPRKKRDHR